METQLDIYDEGVEFRARMKEVIPDVMTAQVGVAEAVYKDGALSAKMKRLISLGIAIRIGCLSCIIGQTKQAVAAGATKEEVMEAASAAITMGGTPSVGWSYRVVKVLEELGKW